MKPERRWIVGLALDARGVAGSSEDFLLMDAAKWTPGRVQAAEQLRQELGFFIPGRAMPNHIDEHEHPRA